jgi:hypothetical protein
VQTICRALGYDLNTVEFAIKDGVPYAIDFMNPAPDAELASVGEYNHNWVVNSVTDFIFARLEKSSESPAYRWDAMLNLGSTETTVNAVTTAPKAKIARPKKTEFSETNIAPKGKTARVKKAAGE